MALDFYDPCPCGSGRKLKFCCRDIVPDMERVLKFQENNQPRMALNAVDEVAKKHPENSWVRATRGGLYFDQGNVEEAHREFAALVAVNPEHGFALALLALIRLSEVGYGDACEDIERAFRKCVVTRPDLVCNLALGIAAWMRLEGELLASRQHLVLALQLAPTAEQQQQIFMRLVEFDGTHEIPCLFRSGYTLVEEGDEEVLAVAGCGCWSEAARRYEAMADESPGSWGLRYNEGLCRAWSGQGLAAVEVLKRAADLVEDTDAAQDCQALAQLLELGHREDGIQLVSRRFGIESASKWLTDLDQHERFVRVDGPDEQQEGEPVGLFHLVDRSIVADSDDPLTLETVPCVSGRLLVNAALEETGASIQLVGRSGEEIAAAEAALREVGSDLVQSEGEGDAEEVVELIPRDFQSLYVTWHFTPKTPVGVKRQLHRDHVEQFVTTTWPNTALAALGGRTPREVAGDPEMIAALGGAVRVLETHCEQNQLSIDVAAVRQALQLPESATIVVESDDQLATMSLLQLLRTVPADLDDELLAALLNRVLLVRHSRLLFDVLHEFIGRDEFGQGEDFHRAVVALAELSQQRHDREAALEWLARGRDAVAGLENEFERSLQYEMQELMLRIETPDDPKLRDLMGRLWNVYGNKIPQLREQLQMMAETYAIVPPWDDEGGNVSASGLWTPGETTTATDGEGEEKKLWIPGQD
ncbi:MAG: hypothetical protein CMJ65_10300 [Planctomycetaceae bacterium]|jgi:tetratricopeptide (TPR) repeat protein|nr:hypothetical protein [Planctomycetaceae bacterium]MDP7276674.1 SEC-C metal-binding domain-containing protein [Planctomycetaceae bacterium]